MKSENADKFNHDDDASWYDRDVRDESHPIRAGYDALLAWVADLVPPQSEVVELGSGTGNLAIRIDDPKRLVCVDISENMTAIARDKLAGRPCEFVCADLLECLDTIPIADAIVSTYAIHHLTPNEKPVLFRGIYDRLRPGGVAVFGDLMFEDRSAEDAICESYVRAGRQELVDDIRDEFFWYLDEAVEQLRQLGFTATHRRFSELSWGIVARKPAA